MVDMLPFPQITAKETTGQVAELVNYLIQFKEILEFNLGNISADNLSPELLAKFDDLGAEIKKSTENNEDQLQQVARYKFRINFDTGHLEYS